METDDVVLAQLQATASSAEAAAINARLAIAVYQGSAMVAGIAGFDGNANGDRSDGGPVPNDDTNCPHLQREDSSVMNPDGETREYCKACRHHIYGDGRAEAAS